MPIPATHRARALAVLFAALAGLGLIAAPAASAAPPPGSTSDAAAPSASPSASKLDDPAAFPYVNSPLGTPLPANAPIAPDSADAVRIAQQTEPDDYIKINANNGWGVPVAYGDCSDPLWRIAPEGKVPPEAADIKTVGFHAPADFGGGLANNDAPVVIKDECGTSARPSGLSVLASNATVGPNNTLTTNPASNSGVIKAGAFTHGTSGLANGLPGGGQDNASPRGRNPDNFVITDAQLEAAMQGANGGTLGYAPHVFLMETNAAAGTGPTMVGNEAGKNGQGCGGASNPTVCAEGQRLRIDPSVDLASRPGCTGAALVVAKTLQLYGGEVGDNSGSGTGIKGEETSRYMKPDLLAPCMHWSDTEWVDKDYLPPTGGPSEPAHPLPADVADGDLPPLVDDTSGAPMPPMDGDVTGEPTPADPSVLPDPLPDGTLPPAVAPQDPIADPTTEPTGTPADPSAEPTTEPSAEPTDDPSVTPTDEPSADPTAEPSAEPTTDPAGEPVTEPTDPPVIDPTDEPTADPSTDPADPAAPSEDPAAAPAPVTPPVNPAIDGPVGTNAGASQVLVSTDEELTAALATAVPGTVIRLADGTYGQVTLSKPGVRVTGGPDAVINGGDTSAGYALHVDGADGSQVDGITITGGQKGVVIDNTTGFVLDSTIVAKVGMEGVHVRNGSSDVTVRNNEVVGTGLDTPAYGECLYVGSAESNSPDGPDQVTGTVLQNNTCSDYKADGVDVKEGTADTTISGNTFDAAGQTGDNYSDQVIALKGENATVEGNTITNPSTAVTDAIQQVQIGSNPVGGNVATGNTCPTQLDCALAG